MTFYRNSDLKKDKYFHQKQFKEQINEAKSHGKEIFYNTIRKINNCYHARKLNGDIYIKDIFILYWELFKIKFKDKLTRLGLVKTIDSFVSCHNFDNGYLFYECPNCNNFHMIGFSCHTRFCPSCGKKYRDQRTIKVSEKCIEVPHRQFVFTIPFQLREYFRKYRKLLNILFQSVKETLNLCLKNKAPNLYIKEKRTLGFISFLHTYGRDMKWHPHIHVLIAERYLNNKGQLKKFDYFHFEYLRITFRNILFNNIYNFYKSHVMSSNEIRQMYLLLKDLKKTYTKGYYVYGRKFNDSNSTTKDIKTLTNYIARYASHPAISERRITNLDSNTNQVTWFYDPHEDDDIEDEDKKIGRQYITEDVFEFMAKLLIHLPDKGFQQIRYYGFYSNKFKDKITNNSLFSIAQLNKMIDNTKWVNNLKSSYGYTPLLCHCGHFMILSFNLSFYPRGPCHET